MKTAGSAQNLRKTCGNLTGVQTLKICRENLAGTSVPKKWPIF
jgi:hypothetical protein